ncbi:hypothetical protein [Sphingobium sp. DC-2]|uniref:hypothetical protein n=1 Tax=Sphingobium sp. DC-2 TaxID=1303256 RepID=UPI00068FDB60|nr:hypothetical protein [Sphingobium sp. DC-2]
MQRQPHGHSIPAGAIVFLFNHDATHQLAHTAGILRALAGKRAAFPLVCAFGTRAIAQGVRDIVGEEAAARIIWFDMGLRRAGPVLRLINRIAPTERLARLKRHAAELRNAALIVSPERTCLRLKREWKDGGPQIIFVPHGAGDRSVTYHPDMANFDAMLVSGQKVADEMLGHGLASPETIAIIGYPKFDLIDTDARPSFFDDDRPVFLYNPHFDPYLSSWYRHGHAIINWFAFGPGRNFNLIFAPHIMLFRKKLHISPEYRVMKRRPDLDPRWQGLPNIHVDVDSQRLTDMSYTLGSDAYIGDVSSQIYEFLCRPRPAFFIDTHWRQDGGALPYLSWTAGDVVPSADALFPLLPGFCERGEHYRAQQQRIFDYTMSASAQSSSERGALAILSWMEEGRFPS